MHEIGVIGHGAMARYLGARLQGSAARLVAVLARPGREAAAREALGVAAVTTAEELAARADLVVDCAGHEGLRAHGAALLAAGCPVITLSLGALADEALHAALTQAAARGGTHLRLASGAIGGLDALSAAAVGGLDRVRYTGTKPPTGWRGSPAEAVLDLDRLTAPATHFEGSARDAALRYPKNANVAAAVALAGLGFDATQVRLVADPATTRNTHRIEAEGAFGRLNVTISGDSLPDTPRTSALAAMSAVREVLNAAAPIRF